MPANPISVEIYTASHRVLGRVDPGSGGMYTFMNDRTRSIVEVEGAHLSRLHQPARLVARYPTLTLNKRNVAGMLLSNRSELGSVSMTRHGYSTVRSHWVHVLLPGYELRGMLETMGRLEMSTIFTESDVVFTPLYHAQLEAILFPDIEASGPALLFHSGRVTAMTPMRREDIPEDAPES